MTSCFVCATLNLGHKKSTGTEPFLFPMSTPSPSQNNENESRELGQKKRRNYEHSMNDRPYLNASSHYS